MMYVVGDNIVVSRHALFVDLPLLQSVALVNIAVTVLIKFLEMFIQKALNFRLVEKGVYRQVGITLIFQERCL